MKVIIYEGKQTQEINEVPSRCSKTNESISIGMVRTYNEKNIHINNLKSNRCSKGVQCFRTAKQGKT